MTKTLKLNEVIFREDLYPRIEPNAKHIQSYAENIDVLPIIEVNQHNILIDGYHRLMAHKKLGIDTINVEVIETKSENELLSLSIEKNAKHGWRLTAEDKRRMAIRLYNSGVGSSKDEIKKILSISTSTISEYLSDIDKQLREERKRKIFDMYLACYTQQEIADAVEVSRQFIDKLLPQITELEKVAKLLSEFNDPGFETPIYNVWTFAKKTNEINHYGNSEVRIVENLLYLYTTPFDIVLDPFGGGGSTIDVCKKRMRRYYVSDRKPIIERERDIRLLDIVKELPNFHNRWSDVALAYLDPPYWRQALNAYSDDKEDLANMQIDEFNNALSGIINRLSEKMPDGSHIALLIQPTQWRSDGKKYTDHVYDMLRMVSKKLRIVNRISCPYSTQQCTPQQVEWAKENKELLVISRELIVWSVK